MPSLRASSLAALLLLALGSACDCTGNDPDDMRDLDGATRDAASDAQSGTDAGESEAGESDADLDASELDADLDASESDAGELDAGLDDAGELDAGLDDAGALDAGTLDAGSDAGPPAAWSTLASLSPSRFYTGIATDTAGLVYFTGGQAPSASALVQRLDPSTGMITTVASMIGARLGHGTVSIGDAIYAITGFNGSWASTAEVYDVATDTWTPIASVPAARVYVAAAVGLDGRIYVFGGASTGTFYANTDVQIYTPSTDTWSTGSPMPTGRAWLSAATLLDGRIAVCGGASGGLQADALSVVELYDPATDTWAAGPSTASARKGASAFVMLDGRLVVVGGTSSANTMEVLQPGASSFDPPITLPGGRALNVANAARAPDGAVYTYQGLSGADVYVYR